jgi:carbon storage regulator
MEVIMLVLTRKLNQTIRIGDSIEIKVVAVGANRVRLAISAPRTVSVTRGELVTSEFHDGVELVSAACGSDSSDWTV